MDAAMKRTGHSGKVDGNQTEIADALRAFGCSVTSGAPLGDGFPDLICGAGRNNFLLECKMPGEKFTPKQKKWHTEWRGCAHVVYTVADALAIASHYSKGK
jgi:hypothetical protein